MRTMMLYIDSMQKGGAQRVMANLADHLLELGDRVILVNDIKPIKNIPEYTMKKGVERFFLDQSESDNRFKKNVNRIINLRRVVKKQKVDCIISFEGPPNLRMLSATVGIKTKKIVSVRNDPYKEYGKGLRKRIAQLFFLLADGCVFQTREAADFFLKSTQKKSEIIYNPVNPKFYKADNRDPKKEIAMVGRLQPQKNYYLAIQAFSNVVKKYPDYKLVIYGDGILKIELQNLCKHLNIDNSVIFYGVVDAVEEKLSTASIFLLSSDFEGMPNALMEAMAVGIPVISTDCPCGGPKALIESDIQGILVPCGNIDKMSEALCRLIENEGLRIKMGLEAKKRALDFLPEIVFKAWDDYVNKVCIQ